MNRVNIIFKINEEDNFTVDEKYIEYQINHNNRFTYTFWNKKLELQHVDIRKHEKTL
ncbi:hypothetical protein WKU33_16635 [Oceanobacillus sp. HCA-5259]|uniref:hypothetical protein n=1 Tax=Oceanobacillus sp. HCA-5259 TaxID=3134661 RepID=UPI0030C16C2C